MYGLARKGTKELLHFEVINGIEDGELACGPIHYFSECPSDPLWLVGNYDVALNAMKYPQTGFGGANYEHPAFHSNWFDQRSYRSRVGGRLKIELEVVEVKMMVK